MYVVHCRAPPINPRPPSIRCCYLERINTAPDFPMCDWRPNGGIGIAKAAWRGIYYRIINIVKDGGAEAPAKALADRPAGRRRQSATGIWRAGDNSPQRTRVCLGLLQLEVNPMMEGKPVYRTEPSGWEKQYGREGCVKRTPAARPAPCNLDGRADVRLPANWVWRAARGRLLFFRFLRPGP